MQLEILAEHNRVPGDLQAKRPTHARDLHP
jgi:hypothetical protein